MSVQSDVDPTLLPVRMLNEFAYCPRLFHLMHVEGRWESNVYTAEGTIVHRRVDRLDHVLPDPDAVDDGSGDGDMALQGHDDEPPTVSRSVSLSSLELGLTAKLDLVSTVGTEAVPVETKRGTVPDNPDRSHEPERVQLMAQGLLLREQGYSCDHGVLYFAASRTRVDVQFTPELEARTRALLMQAQIAAGATKIPAPLDNSPKCNGCSLNGICLPDETLVMNATSAREGPRRLFPVRVHATPLYVQDHGAVIGKSGATLIIRKDGRDLGTVPVKDISQVVICGNAMMTPQAVHLLCERNIPIVHSTMGHWFYGVTAGFGLRNAYDRVAQYAVAGDGPRSLDFAKGLVAAKAANQRTMLRRNGEPSDDVLKSFSRLAKRIDSTSSIESLRGIEGSIAALYFRSFNGMVRSSSVDTTWSFDARNRRPPLDPINALLSFSYAMLVKEFAVALFTEGLDPWWGLYHKPKHGKPALALDMMEPYRPLIADSAVITAINTGMISSKDFIRSAAGCMLKEGGRKAMIRAFESRLDHLITHPTFGYRCSWRSALRVQVRLLARWLRQDIPTLDHIITR